LATTLPRSLPPSWDAMVHVLVIRRLHQLTRVRRWCCYRPNQTHESNLMPGPEKTPLPPQASISVQITGTRHPSTVARVSWEVVGQVVVIVRLVDVTERWRHRRLRPMRPTSCLRRLRESPRLDRRQFRSKSTGTKTSPNRVTRLLGGGGSCVGDSEGVPKTLDPSPHESLPSP